MRGKSGAHPTKALVEMELAVSQRGPADPSLPGFPTHVFCSGAPWFVEARSDLHVLRIER